MASTAKKYARHASNAGKQSSRVGLSLVLALAGGGYAGYRWLTDEEEVEEAIFIAMTTAANPAAVLALLLVN